MFTTYWVSKDAEFYVDLKKNLGEKNALINTFSNITPILMKKWNKCQNHKFEQGKPLFLKATSFYNHVGPNYENYF
jgi:hypothetical protein